VIVVVYALFLGFTFYFCVMADPETSPISRYISHTLPAKFIKLVGKVVGKKGVAIFETIMEKLLAIIYLTLMTGGYLILIMYGFPKALQSTHIPNYHVKVAHGLFFFALYTWRLTMTRYADELLADQRSDTLETGKETVISIIAALIT